MAPRVKPHTRAEAAKRETSPNDGWANALIAKMLAACHPYQVDVVEDDHRRISLLVGRGGGKTTVFCIRGVRRCLTKRRAHILYFAKTRQRAKELLWYPLKDLCDKLGLEPGVDVLFSESELRCTVLRTGSVYQLSGMEDMADVDKWRGQSYDEVQIDEGASHREELLTTLLYEVLGPRMRHGAILIAGSAGRFLAGKFYDISRPGSDQHRPYRDRERLPPAAWSSHRWTLDDVVELPDARKKYPALCELWDEAQIEFDKNKWGPDHPVRKREYAAIWALDDTAGVFQYRPRTDDGEPWNEWDPEMLELGPDRVKVAKLPEGPEDWIYAFAMDHGNKDPFALNVFAASPSDPNRTIYHVYGFEQPGMYARRIAILLMGPTIATDLQAAHDAPGGVIGAVGFPAGMVADDKQVGKSIRDELSAVYGITVTQAEQAGKHAGIELVNGDLQEGRLKILKGSTLAFQLANLQWRPDEYGFMKENKAQANHATDTLIYGRRLLAYLFGNIGDRNEKDERRARGEKRDVFADPMGLDEQQMPGEYDYLFGGR